MTANFLSKWTSIGVNDRLVIKDSFDPYENSSIGIRPKNRAKHKNLHHVIQRIILEIDSANRSKKLYLADVNEEISKLETILKDRVRRYEKSYCSIYLLARKWLFQEDLTADLLAFHRLVEKAQAARENHRVKPSAALPTLPDPLIPIDHTAELDPLFSADFYLKTSEEGRLQMVSCFIHLLPLASFLGTPSTKILEILPSIPIDEKDIEGSRKWESRKDFICKSAIKLVEKTLGLTWENDWKIILKLFFKSGMNDYFYHGTHEVAFEYMLQNGLKSEKRDFSREMFQGFRMYEGISAFTSTLYVAGNPTNSFEYGASSPEWLLLFKHDNQKDHKDDPSYQRIVQRYSGKTHFILIQIKTAPNVRKDTHDLTRISKLSARPRLADQYGTRDLLIDLILHSDNNRVFNESALQISAFRIPNPRNKATC